MTSLIVAGGTHVTLKIPRGTPHMENNSQPYYMVFIIKTLPFQSRAVSTNKAADVHFSINYPHFPSIYTALHSHQPREVGQCAYGLGLPQRRRQASAVFCSGVQIFGKITNKRERATDKKVCSLQTFVLSEWAGGGANGEEKMEDFCIVSAGERR